LEYFQILFGIRIRDNKRKLSMTVSLKTKDDRLARRLNRGFLTHYGICLSGLLAVIFEKLSQCSAVMGRFLFLITGQNTTNCPVSPLPNRGQPVFPVIYIIAQNGVSVPVILAGFSAVRQA
jgi:hypothetical protein